MTNASAPTASWGIGAASRTYRKESTMPTVMRGAELMRVVAVYECGECGREYALNEGEDYTGVPPQEFMHRCDDGEE